MKKQITQIVLGVAALSAVAAFALPTTIGKDVTPSGDLQLQGTTKNLENVFAIDATAKAKSNTQKAKVNGLALSAEMTAAEKKQIRDMYEGPSRVRANAADVTLPYENTFSAATDLEGWTIIDGNNDSKKWTWYNANGGAVRVAWNSSMAMDDWLISPAIPVEAGKNYDFSLEAYSSTSYPEKVEVLYGTAATAEAMTTVLVAPTTVQVEYANSLTLEGSISAEATGDIYIGIHGISDKDEYYLYVDNFYVSAAVAGTTPVAPSNVTFTKSTDNAKAVTIGFDVPTITIGGDPTTITEAKILCDGTEIKSWANPTEARLEYTYTAEEAGDYEFTIVCANADGLGKEYSETIYLGVDLAMAPQNCEVMEWASTPGKVTVSWEPVAKDVNGNDINLSDVTYTVLDKNSVIIEEDIPATAPECTFQAVPEGQQAFVYFFVVPVTDKGANVNAGGYGATDMIACGTPYEMPFVEGITSEGLAHILGVSYPVTKYSSPQQIRIITSSSSPAAQPVNGDGAMLAWWPWATEELQVYTGKITVAESEYASMSFYYHTTNSAGYTIKPYVIVAGNLYYLLDDDEAISTQKPEGDEQLEWKRVIIPMVDYISSDVQLGIHVTCVSDDEYCLLDQIELIDIYQNDLAVVSIAGPRGVEVGDEANITAGIQNVGAQESAAATAQLLCNGEVADTQEVPALAPNQLVAVTFTVTPDVFSDPQYAYQVKIVNDGDQNEDNNLSDNITIIISQPMLNEVTDLEAVFANDVIDLTWSAPEAMETPDPTVTESFEDAATFTEVVDGWTIIDGDGKNVGNTGGETFPSGKRGWIVTDQNIFADSDGTVPEVWQAHSGNNFMCTMYNTDGSKNDDWLITPELSGEAQTITLWADAVNTTYGAEILQLLYSETDTDPGSFTLIEQYSITESGWIEYSAEVPAGAKYFAIHYASKDTFTLKVDDVTYTGLTKTAPVVESYNVYRNGEKIAEGLTETTYTDEDWMFDTEYTYYVTAVYSNSKESALSNPAEVTTPPVTIEDLNALSDFPAETNFIMDGALTVIYCDAEAGIAIVTDGVSNASMSVESTEYKNGDVLATGWQGIYSEGLVMILPLEDPEVASSAAAIEPVECDAEDIATQQAKNFNYVTVNYLTIDAEAIEEAAETDNLSIVAYALDTPVLMVNLFAIDLPVYAGTYSVTGFFAENPETIAQMDGQSTKQYIFIPVEFVEHFETVESLSALADFPEMTRFIMGCPLTVIYSNELGAVVTDGESNAFFHNDTNYAEGNVLETGWHAVFYGEGLLGIGCVDEENPGTTGTAEVAAPADCMPEDIAVMQAKDLNYVKLLYVEIDEEAVAEAEENDGMFMLAQAGETPVLIVNYFDADLPNKAGVFEITGFWAINAESPIAPATEGELSKQYIFVPVSFLETDAIAGIEAVNDNAVYYDLKGIQITNPQSGKVYIRAIDGKVAKVIVK